MKTVVMVFYFNVYNDPRIGLKDKILFFFIHFIYCIQLTVLYCASKVSELSRMLSNIVEAVGVRIYLVLIKYKCYIINSSCTS